MEKEMLIKKWLDGSLNPEELKAFDALEESAELKRISKAMAHFKAPDFNTEEALDRVNQKKTQTKNAIPVYKRLMPIAALLVLAIGITYFLTYSAATITTTTAGEMATINLPDTTKVTLNAASTLEFDEDSWNTNRRAKLKGEAYFNVTKGSKFTVETSQGDVTVLGTQFNVKQRGDFFEVHCFEGSVQVVHTLKTVILKPGDYISAHSNNLVKGIYNLSKQPTWVEGKSHFKSAPYQEVLNEIARQFNVTINTNFDTKKPLFTGTFSNTNLDEALKTVTMPLKLKYEITGQTVVIENE